MRLEIGIDTMGQKPTDPKDAATKPTGNPGENGDPMGSVKGNQSKAIWGSIETWFSQ